MTDKEILEANLVKLLGIELLPLEKKVKILQRASELVQKRLFVRLLQQLSEEEQVKFLDLVKADNLEKEREEFFAAHFPKMAEMMEEEIIKIKQELQSAIE